MTLIARRDWKATLCSFSLSKCFKMSGGKVIIINSLNVRLIRMRHKVLFLQYCTTECIYFFLYSNSVCYNECNQIYILVDRKIMKQLYTCLLAICFMPLLMRLEGEAGIIAD